MGRPFIVMGDRTSHGGVVVEASQLSLTHNKPIARVGDQVTCPIPWHGTTVIVEGDPTMIIDGKPAARHGDKCACGAVLISSQVVSTVGGGGGGSGANAHAADTGQGSSLTHTEQPTDQSSPLREVRFQYDEQTKLVVTGNTATLVGLPWFIKTEDGKTYSGRLDESGQLPRVSTESEGRYETYWGDEALEHMEAHE